MSRCTLPALLALGFSIASIAHASKSLLVDLSKSTVYAMENGRVVRALVINPGAGNTPTRPGKYRISQKVRTGYRSNLIDIHNKPLRKGGVGAPMDYWMRLGGTAMGFHRSSRWSPSGQWASNGCLRMSREGARWLHDWTPMGAPVTVVSGGTQYASAVKSRKDSPKSGVALAKSPKRSDRVKTASAVRPSAAMAKRKAPAKPVATASKSKPAAPPAAEAPTVAAPEPAVAPITTAAEESVSEPNTFD